MSSAASAFLGVVCGLAIGATLVWAYLASRLAAARTSLEAERTARSEAATELRAERQRATEAEAALREGAARSAEREDSLRANITEQQRFLNDAKKQLEDTFKVRSIEAMTASQKTFLDGAKEFFEQQSKAIGLNAEQKQKAIDDLVKPVREALERQEKSLQAFDEKRATSFSGITEQIKSMQDSGEILRRETVLLGNALRRSDQKGRWGELQLRNCVELAGMTEHCDFVEQLSVSDEEGTLRPDMIVKLPGGGVIVVDSKVALTAYLDMLQPDADRESLAARHTAAFATHWQQLSKKEYWSAMERQGYRTPKVVVMFVPVESALAAALERSPDMHADAMKNHVLIVTPTLLVALLRSVAYGWQQEDLAANAREIAKAGARIYERLAVFAGHLNKVGTALGRATEAYNDSVGSLEHNLLPAARQMQELNISVAKKINEPEPIERSIRGLTAPELTQASPMEPRAIEPRPADAHTIEAQAPAAHTADTHTTDR